MSPFRYRAWVNIVTSVSLYLRWPSQKKLCAFEEVRLWSSRSLGLRAKVGGNCGEHRGTVDLRQNNRYQLKAAVKFTWRTDDSDVLGEGNTRDISLDGVFVVTNKRVVVGTAVQLEVSLPSLRSTRSGICLRGSGKVIRVEETGFAAVADTKFRIQFPGGAGRYESTGRCPGPEQRNQHLRCLM